MVECAGIFYSLSLLCFFLSLNKSDRKKIGKSTINFTAKLFWGALGAGFILHSAALFFKGVVFTSPPFTTLFDCTLFVAWLSIVMGFIFFVVFKTAIPVIGSLIFTEGLFLFLYGLNVQDPFTFGPLFNPRFPSILVVLGYGILFFGGILSHFALVKVFQEKKETSSPFLSRSIALSLCFGNLFFVVGLLFESLLIKSSYAYFWNLKELWIAVSICFYLVLIHLTHFKWVDPFIVALGSCLGMGLLSFASYGVNFFGESSWQFYEKGHKEALFYLIYIAFEVLFLSAVLIRKGAHLKVALYRK